MRMFLSILVSAVVFISAANAQPCATTRHRDLDFWLGEWDVTNADGQPSGSSRVERKFDGCVVVENWTSVKGGYAGMSLNTYDPATSRWTQHWVDNGGMSVEMAGEFQGRNLVYSRQFKKKDGTPAVSRMTFFPLDAGVRQLVEQSTDGGTTWTTTYDLRYHRHVSR